MLTAGTRRAFIHLPGVGGLATVMAVALLVIAAGLAFTSAAPVYAESDDENSEAVETPPTEDEIEDVRDEIKFDEYNWDPLTGNPPSTGSDNPSGSLDSIVKLRNQIKFHEYNPYLDPDDVATNPTSEADQSEGASSTAWPGINDLDLVEEPRLHHRTPPEVDSAAN